MKPSAENNERCAVNYFKIPANISNSYLKKTGVQRFLFPVI
jgi:hypothetical protein